MTDNYKRIARENLARLYRHLPDDLDARMGAERIDKTYAFTAFGQACCLSPDGITLDGGTAPGVIGILLSLYALNAAREACVLEPLKAFKEFPATAPYVGAFASHIEQILVPAVPRIKNNLDAIRHALGGGMPPASIGGDFALLVRPLPKICLSYIIYEADEDFPASVTCLYSNNADAFMRVDGLADVGEYTSRRILQVIG